MDNLVVKVKGQYGEVEISIAEIVSADNYSKKNPTFNNVIEKAAELYEVLQAKAKEQSND